MKPLQFGLIGLGYFGKNYARLLQTIPGVQLAAIANTSRQVLTANNLIPDSILKTTDPAVIFSNPAIDCVVIATPPSTHFSLIKQALVAGKHILVEKPLVLSLADAKKLVALKKAKDQVLMVGFQYMYNDYLRFIKTYLQKQKLGKIRYVFAENLYCGPIRQDVGSLVDAGSHEISMLEFLFAPGKIISVAGMRHVPGKDNNDDFAAVSVQFKSGLLAQITTSWFAPEKVRKMTIVGEKGMIVFNDRLENDKIQIFSRTYPIQKKGQEKSSLFVQDAQALAFVPVVKAGEPLYNEVKHFIACVRSGIQPVTDLKFGYTVTEKMQTIFSKVKVST